MVIITVSRGSMSGGVEFAECLARRLHYRCLSREVVVKAAEKIGVPEDMLLAKIEKSANLWERLTANRRLYLLAVQTALADACLPGDLVYHGHAGHLLLKGLPRVLRVRLIAPMPLRIRAVMEKQRLSYDAARDYILNVDEERVRWTKFVYGVDWQDPANYDLLINLAEMTIDSACAIVAAAALLPAYRTAPADGEQIADFALACRVKLALAQHLSEREASFDVSAHGGEVKVLVELPGSYLLAKQSSPAEGEIRRVVEGVGGVETLNLTVRRFPQGTQA